MRVVIVGAGPAGLASARHVAAIEGIECEILEMAPFLGGNWLYTDDVDQDRYGFPVYSAMYQGLRTNLPKQVMEFPDFPIQQPGKTYLTQIEVLDFFNKFAKNFDIERLIKFDRMVKDIRPLGEKWQLTSIHKPTKETITSVYDSVMICSGHYNEPKIAHIEGQDQFSGKIMHSRQYRSPEPFQGKRVLIIGVGSSGLDLTVQLSDVAEFVVISYHSEVAKSTTFPNKVIKKPDVLRIKSAKEVEFVDGSSYCFDAIIQSTGYNFAFPFLHESCGVTVDGNNVQPLYKHMIYCRRPTMCFIGLPKDICVIPMVDMQARFFCKFLDGSITLPTTDKMLIDLKNDEENRKARGYAKNQAHFMGPDQLNYFRDLANACNTTAIRPVIVKLWEECREKRYSDFMNLREYKYIVGNESFVIIPKK